MRGEGERGEHDAIESAVDEDVVDGLAGLMVAENEGTDAGPVGGGHGGGGSGERGGGGVGEHGFAGEALGLEGTKFVEGLVEGAFEAAVVEFEAREGGGLVGVEGIEGGVEGDGPAEVPGGEEEMGKDFEFEGAGGSELRFEFAAHFFENRSVFDGEAEMARGKAMGD